LRAAFGTVFSAACARTISLEVILASALTGAGDGVVASVLSDGLEGARDDAGVGVVGLAGGLDGGEVGG